VIDRWERIDNSIGRVEQALLVVLLSLMILTAFLQIILRNLFASGLSWGDPLVRNLVLWVGFTGAAMATREGKHIRIDVFSRWAGPVGRDLAESTTQLFSFLICGLLTHASLKFIRNEAQMGGTTLWGVPSWIPQVILPATFALMSVRFGLRSFGVFSATLRRIEKPR
jgi:TRAP-type C4-dicarboxylate transport system permease small subunit